MDRGKLWDIVDSLCVLVFREYDRQHLEEHHRVNHRHKFMADGKDSWTDLGIKHSNTNDPYKPDNLTEVHNVDLNKMSSSSHKTPKRNVNIQCPECLKFFPADRAGFMSEPNQCDHYSHKDSYFIGSNKWRELVGLELNEFCPKCGRKLSW